MSIAKPTLPSAVPIEVTLLAAKDSIASLDWLVDDIAKQQRGAPHSTGLVIWDGDLAKAAQDRLVNVVVQPILAGCACCLGGPVLKTAVAKAIRTHRPQHLWIVGGHSALLSGLADALKSPFLDHAISVTRMVWVANLGLKQSDWFEQAECATMIVNPHLVKVDPRHHPWVAHTEPNNSTTGSPNHYWPSDALFDRKALHLLFKSLNEVATIKSAISGIFRTERTHYYGASLGAEVVWRDTSWRLDSRLRIAKPSEQIIVPTTQTNSQSIITQFNDCRIR